jgi:hypothetical protein
MYPFEKFSIHVAMHVGLIDGYEYLCKLVVSEPRKRTTEEYTHYTTMHGIPRFKTEEPILIVSRLETGKELAASHDRLDSSH